MSGLQRRLTALEETAEEVRTRPVRRMVADLARVYGWTPAQEADFLAQGLIDTEAWAQQRDAMLRSGMTVRQVVRHVADELGVTVEELEAEHEKVTRYF